MMKKCVLLTMVWLCLLSGGAVARNKEGVAYEIHFDSDTIQTYPLQQQLQETYEQLMQGIQEESSYTVLVHNLSMFESEDVRVRMQQGILQVWQGDGKGAVVKGKLAKWKACVAEVEPRSWFASLFS